MIPIYEGETYLAPSGQWSWMVRENGADITCGAGCETEDAAWQAMFDELSSLTDGHMFNLLVPEESSR